MFEGLRSLYNIPIAIPNCFDIILNISLTLGKGWKILVSSSFIIDMKYQDTRFDWDICIHKTKFISIFNIRIIIYDVSKYIAIWDARMHHIKEIIIILSFTDTRIYSNIYYMQTYCNISMLSQKIYIPISLQSKSNIRKLYKV